MNATMLTTLLVCFFGSGGLIIWILNRAAAKADRNDETAKAVSEIRSSMRSIQEGLVMTLENDKVIFRALRTHEINGESEEQEKKMDSYFLTLISKREKNE
jgi:hypothetical protein